MTNLQHEPTMEEMLASIRKIISDDTSEPEAAPKPTPEVSPEPEVLELTQEVHDIPPSPPVSAPVADWAPQESDTDSAPPPPAVSAPVADIPPPISFPAAAPPPVEIASQPIEEIPVSSQVEASVHSSEGIFSDKSRKALDDTFASLAPDSTSAVSATAPVAPVDGPTVTSAFDRAIRETFEPVLQKWLDDHADAIIERMKPLIGEWLDEHFPAMLEDAVRGEVARVAKTRVRR